MSTPEAKVKAAVKKLLASYDGLYYNMPVPGGYGEPMLDFVGCFKGKFFMVETKAEGKKLTPRQEYVRLRVENAGGRVFIVEGLLDGPEAGWRGWGELAEWLSDMAAGRYTAHA